VSNIGEGQVNAATEHPARRASDWPHSFKQIEGFRTCGVCGLKQTHKIHREKSSAN